MSLMHCMFGDDKWSCGGYNNVDIRQLPCVCKCQGSFIEVDPLLWSAVCHSFQCSRTKRVIITFSSTDVNSDLFSPRKNDKYKTWSGEVMFSWLCLMLCTPSFRNIREKLKILEFWTFRKFLKVMEKGNEWSVVTLAEHIRPMWLMLEPAWSLQTVFYISWYVAVDYIALIFFWNDDCIVAGWFLLSRLVATATGSTQAKCSHTVACYSAWAPARYFDPWWRRKSSPTECARYPINI